MKLRSVVLLVGLVGPRGIGAMMTRSVTPKAVSSMTLSAPADSSSSSFGTATALSDNTLVVGDPHAMNHQGAVFVYAKNEVSDAWSLQETLTGSGHHFGSSVKLDRDTILVGSRTFDSKESASSTESSKVVEEVNHLSVSRELTVHPTEIGPLSCISPRYACAGSGLGLFFHVCQDGVQNKCVRALNLVFGSSSMEGYCGCCGDDVMIGGECGSSSTTPTPSPSPSATPSLSLRPSASAAPTEICPTMAGVDVTFTLFNIEGDEMVLTNGTVVDLAEVGTKFNVRMDPSSHINSLLVEIDLFSDGTTEFTFIDPDPPYTLGGPFDAAEELGTNGTHTIWASPFCRDTGMFGDFISIAFTVIGELPSLPPSEAPSAGGDFGRMLGGASTDGGLMHQRLLRGEKTVSARRNDENSDSGILSVFSYTDTDQGCKRWTPSQQVNIDNMVTMDLSAETVVLGSTHDLCHVVVYQRWTADSLLVKTQQIDFGESLCNEISLSLDEDVMLVGVSGTSKVGALYVYVRHESDFVEVERLALPDAIGPSMAMYRDAITSFQVLANGQVTSSVSYLEGWEILEVAEQDTPQDGQFAAILTKKRIAATSGPVAIVYEWDEGEQAWNGETTLGFLYKTASLEISGPNVVISNHAGQVILYSVDTYPE